MEESKSNKEIKEILREIANAIHETYVGEIKTIYVPEMKPMVKKIPKKRVVTSQKQWVQYITRHDESLESQSTIWSIPSKKQDIARREIRRKLDGYRRQDISKDKYDPIRFVDFPYVLELLETNPYCYYCEEPVKILYEISRDPKQWTLERIQNTNGHNKDNVKISCLCCNLRRRTMYHEKYKFTKQLNLTRQSI